MLSPLMKPRLTEKIIIALPPKPIPNPTPEPVIIVNPGTYINVIFIGILLCMGLWLYTLYVEKRDLKITEINHVVVEQQPNIIIPSNITEPNENFNFF